MKKFVIPIAIASISLASFASFALSIPKNASASGHPSTLCVNAHDKHCYSTIQAAVNAASKGATINIAPGTYTEQVTINKTAVTLTSHNAVINAAGLPNGLVIDGAATSGTTVKELAVENANLEGVLVQDTSHITLQNNTVEFNDKSLVTGARTCAGALPLDQMDCGEGIHVLSTSYSTITKNTAENNSGGILFSDETGATRNNYVAYNTVENNKVDCGITLASHGTNTGVYNNVVAHNTSIGNGGAGVGIFAPIPGTGSYNNTILDNITKNNADGGVSLHSHSPETNVGGNKIIGNTISGNMVHPGSGAPTPAGIVLFADSSHGAPVIKNTTITGNTLSGETIDVYVGTAQTELALQANNLLGGSGTIGVENAGSSGTVNATANYWGCAAGPNHPNCTTTQGSVNAALALLK